MCLRGGPRKIGWPSKAKALLTCGAVHHCGCHAVGLGLGAHQAGAVVHGLAVGRAGGHEATLVHARKTALPAGREQAEYTEHHSAWTVT